MSADRLKSFAERILKLMDERDAIGGDIKDVFTEVKSAGFNAPALRKVIASMRMDPEKREALEFDIDAYRLAVGLERAQAEEMIAGGAGVRETHRATGVALGTLSKVFRKQKQNSDVNTQTDRASNARRAPEGAGEGVSPAPDPIPEPPAGSASSPAGSTQAPSAHPPAPDGPAGDDDAGWQAKDSAGNHAVAIGAIRERHVASGNARLDAGDIPAILRRGSPENDAIRGGRP